MDHCDVTFAMWRDRVRSEIDDESAQVRLRHVQRLLCELVQALDPGRVRYTQGLDLA
jgi:hypothetical protein